ncbi:hypothetical protein I6F15_11380 [Bradyrhizobium sp. BRP14]|nr:hypothetical protein [Bradyrhizobium sp. BRP14]
MQAFRARTTGIDLIPPERRPRSNAAAVRPLDYIDVEFETIAATVRRSPYPVFNDNRRSAGRPVLRPATVRGNEGVAERVLAAVEARLSVMPSRRFAGLVAGLALSAFLLVAGFSGEGQADMHPLAIEGISASMDYSGGMRVLAVYGRIDNRSATEQRLPPVVVDVTSNGRKVTSTRLTLEGAPIAPGESRHFVTRLPYAGGKEPDVAVSFAENSVSDH